MKCPDCESSRYERNDLDPGVMICEDCHAWYSIQWSRGFWVGYLKAEKKYKRYLTNIIEQLGKEKYVRLGRKEFGFEKGWNEMVDRCKKIVKEEMGGE